jgi:hypothetical protein
MPAIPMVQANTAKADFLFHTRLSDRWVLSQRTWLVKDKEKMGHADIGLVAL